MGDNTIGRMQSKAKARTDAAKGRAKPAFYNVWVKMGTPMRDELARLRGAPLSVLIYLATRINHSGQCNPGVELIARQTGYKVRQVQYALRFLRAEGFIAYDVQDNEHSDRSYRTPSNVYSLVKQYKVESGESYALFAYGKGRKNGKGEDG